MEDPTRTQPAGAAASVRLLPSFVNMRPKASSDGASRASEKFSGCASTTFADLDTAATMRRLEEADGKMGLMLIFENSIVEARYMEELGRQRLCLTTTLSLVWALFFSIEFFLNGFSSYVRNGDEAAKLTAWSRILSVMVLLLGALCTRCQLCHFETAAMVMLGWVSVGFITSNTHRASRFFGTDFADRVYADCGAEHCYDDSALLLGLVITAASTPLLLSVRISRSWVLTPITAGLYAGTSLTGIGPLPPVSHLLLLIMYVMICAFLIFGSYRIEKDARCRWFDNLRLLIDIDIKTADIERHKRRVMEVEEQLDAMGSIHETGSTKTAEAPVVQDDYRAHCAVPRPAGQVCELAAREASDSEAAAALELEPNPLLAQALRHQRADAERLRRMAAQIADPDYGLREFFEDCTHAFPELELFFAAGAGPWAKSGELEYQRTVGALFAVYWTMRLDTDGKQGFCFGCDEQWRIHKEPAGANALKRLKFVEHMDWADVERIVGLATEQSPQRVEAMLCLTAFHDIMKVPELRPTVAARHAPYEGFAAGDVIHDHDLALAYVLEHYPELLPSFRILPQSSRDVVLFTQGKMHFNHGWFVQAEAPPGAMLSRLKEVLASAQPNDLAFYFYHWLTDLSGAEGTPLAGAEKFVLFFPRAVLSAFLWSIPYLQKLAYETESVVVEEYLEARFRAALPGQPLPKGEHAVALMRLVVMAQSAARHVLSSFPQLPPSLQRVLSVELARTGLDGQCFRNSRQEGGPALFVYYGPALLQRSQAEGEMLRALAALAAVYRAGRRLWPLHRTGPVGRTVALEAGMLKSLPIHSVIYGLPNAGRSIWILERQGDLEATVELVSARELNVLRESGKRFCAVDLDIIAENVSEAQAESAVDGTIEEWPCDQGSAYSV